MNDAELVLADPWVDLRGSADDAAAMRDGLAAEVGAEVAAGHPLYRADFSVIGRSLARDDVLIRATNGDYAIVHLTFRRPDTPPWPSTAFYDSLDAVHLAIANAD